MRTTLTLEPDVAALLRRARARRREPLKTIVNEALRRGLADVDAPPRRRPAYRTAGLALGRCLIGGLDDVAGALAAAEGEAFR